MKLLSLLSAWLLLSSVTTAFAAPKFYAIAVDTDQPNRADHIQLVLENLFSDAEVIRFKDRFTIVFRFENGLRYQHQDTTIYNRADDLPTELKNRVSDGIQVHVGIAKGFVAFYDVIREAHYNRSLAKPNIVRPGVCEWALSTMRYSPSTIRSKLLEN